MEVVMLATWRKRGWGARIVVVAGLTAMALAAVLASVAVARPLGFLHIRSNLSQTATLISAYPDMSIGSDGDRVVVAWPEEYRDGAGARGHVYLRTASETGVGWGRKILVFSGGDAACAGDAAVAVTGTTAHVVYIVSSGTCGAPTQMQVRYRTCSLDSGQSSGQCDGSESIVTSVGTATTTISGVDLALDGNGAPHVVWTQYDGQGNWGEILYSARGGGGWSSPYLVASNENRHQDNSMPAVAWADDYVHVVWVTWNGIGDLEAEKNKHVLYRQQSASGWEPPVNIFSPIAKSVGGELYYLPPGRPDVAARSGRVFVVWDCCSNSGDPDPGSYCSTYHLVYRRSNDNGVLWPQGTVEVGTSYLYPDSFDQLENYASDVGGNPYTQRLRPYIALNRDGWPAVVWHADRSGGGGEGGGGGGESYTIYYTYALTGTSDSVSWVVGPSTILREYAGDMLCSAAVGVREPDPGDEKPLLHVAYMQKPVDAYAWDVFYDSNEDLDRYKYIYLPLIMRVY
jgi:hypothetical protein